MAASELYPGEDAPRRQTRQIAESAEEAEALERYEALVQLPEAGEWDFFEVARCLHRAGNHLRALEACHQAWARFAEPRPRALLNLAGWCLFRLHEKSLLECAAEVKGEQTVAPVRKPRPEAVVAAVEAAHRACCQAVQESGSLYRQAILKLAQILKGGQQWLEMEQWTAKLDPAQLSATPLQLRAVGRKSGRTIASELETWLALRARALLELGRHEECIAVCQQYKQAISQPHYDWDVWVPSYEVQALAALGRREEAEAVLDRILPKNRASWLLRFRAQLYAEAGDADRAWQTALDAALELAQPEKDPRLLETLAWMAEARGQTEAARRHVELLLAMKKAEGERIPDFLGQKAAALQVTVSDMVSRDHCRRLLFELRRWWWQQLEAVEPRSCGTVERLLGREGALRSDDGQSLYFMAGELLRPEPGQRVDFWVRPHWDAKKRQLVPRAIRLRHVDSSRGKE